MYPEFVVPDDAVEGVPRRPPGRRDRRRSSPQRFGWKIGDRVPLKAPGYLGGTGWDFNVRGIYHGTRANDDETQFWLQHDYLLREGARATGRASSAGTWCASRDPAQARRRSRRRSTRSSPTRPRETRTQTESAFAASFVKQMGNIEFLILAIGSIVFFTLLLVTGNTMAIAVRERTERAGHAEGGRLLATASCSGSCSPSRC